MTDVQAQGGRPDQIRRTRRRGDDGVALVEFAIIMPLLFMLLFGALTGGIVLNRQMSLTHAAREAARYGATLSLSQFTDPAEWAEHVLDVAVARSDGHLTDDDVCAVLLDDDGNELSQAGDPSLCPFPDGLSSGQRVQVAVARPDGEDRINAILFGIDVHLTASATAQHES